METYNFRGTITKKGVILANDKNGKLFCVFNVVNDENYNKIKGDATFINCYVFDSQAKIVKEKCKAGQYVEVDGKVGFKKCKTADNKIVNFGVMMTQNLSIINNSEKIPVASFLNIDRKKEQDFIKRNKTFSFNTNIYDTIDDEELLETIKDIKKKEIKIQKAF